MKRLLTGVVMLGVATGVWAEDIALTTDQEKLSYTIGADIGSNFKQQNIDIDTNILMRGIQDGMSGSDRLMTDEAMEATIQKFQEQLIADRMEQFEDLAEENRMTGEKFLQENKTKEGVVALDNGVQYRVLETGEGVKPTVNDSVTVQYVGRLLDGTVFDSSADHGDSVTLKLNQVIEGWQEALVLMQVGDKWEVFIPADLAYGEQGYGIIGPNETLVFEIGLLSVDKE